MPIAPDAAGPVIEVEAAGAPLLRVWSNGRIDWSGDTVRAGSPLQTATIDPAKVAGAIAAIRGSPLRGGRWIDEIRTGPDAKVTTVRVRDGETPIVYVGSWHELFEADPRLVVTAGGVEPLDGRSRKSVLAQQPVEYRLFRRRWDEVLGRLRSLVPLRQVVDGPAG